MGEGDRPVVRATVQKFLGRRMQYNSANAPGGDYDWARERHGKFNNILFGQPYYVRELRNIKRCTWARSTDRDVAECTLTLLNADIVRMGIDEALNDFEHHGAFTYNNGDTTEAEARWGSQDLGWNRAMTPDKLVRTYEGYGCDPDEAPAHDPHLYASGTWLVDEVTYAANGDLQLNMRDLGRLLLDSICHPPVIPWSHYPLDFSTIRSEAVDGRVPTGGEWKRPAATATSSNNLYVGEGIVDSPKYVSDSGAVLGHQNNHAIRGSEEDYWLSTGQESQDSFVWWEEEFDSPQDLAGIRIHTRAGPHRVFVSLMVGGEWTGKRKIPYQVTTEDIDLEARIKFQHSEVIDRGIAYDITFRKRFENVQKVRLTFTRLRRPAGGTYPWRAALRDVKVYVGATGFTDGELMRPVGNIRDFSDMVKWACAWGGLFWPSGANSNFIKYSQDGDDTVNYEYVARDPILPKGRVWGSFQKTGTSPEADVTADQFDKQPLMDIVAYAKNVTGFSFWFDECGGAIWRMPNLFELGNYRNPHHLLPRRGPVRTTDVVEIDEEETLLEYSTRLSSRNLRERIFVGNSTGKFGANIRGFATYGASRGLGIRSGLRRTSGWTDENFASRRECLVAADMIAVKQLYDFRRSRATIPGNPAIQIDDQVRIWERVTNESYYHYVVGISSDIDIERGTWEYQLETHWLGDNPEDAWIVDPDILQTSTQNYLDLLGAPD